MGTFLGVAGLGLMALLIACSSPNGGPTAGLSPHVAATSQAANQAIATRMALVAAGTVVTTAAAAEHSVLARAPATAVPTPDPPAVAAPARLVVTGGGAAGVSLRSTPGSGARLKVLRDGAELISLGEEQQADGRSWQRVKDVDGTEGWVASEFATASIAPAP